MHEEIGLLKKDINETRAAQKVQIDALRYNVKKDVKDHITQTMRWVYFSEIGASSC